MKPVKTLLTLPMLLLAIVAFAGEREETERIAPAYNAKTEVTLWDQTRVDLLSDEYAIEVDYAPKWAEAIGQSLYYAAVTGRKPGIVLLVSDRSENRFVYRCQTVALKHGIRLWIRKPGETKPAEPDL